MYTRLGNVPNTAGVNHYRCCVIGEIEWCRSRLTEINIYLKKIGDGYVNAALQTACKPVFLFKVVMDFTLNQI